MQFVGTTSAKQGRLAVFSLLVLLYNIPVILWGAYVRVSFSGDGCGADWPFCSGQLIPRAMAKPMAVEYTHRMMTTLDLLLMATLVVWIFRVVPRSHAARLAGLWSAFFLFVEALLGAGLVIFRKVAHDASAGRAVYLSAHLTNTLLLLGALTATYFLLSRDVERLRLRSMPLDVVGALAVTALISITGALAALGDTLFPATSLARGLGQDFASASPALLRIRLFHPAAAVLGAAFLLWISKRWWSSSPGAAQRLAVLVVIQLVFGVANLTLLAPVWAQLTHLLLADLVWIAIVLVALEATLTTAPRLPDRNHVVGQGRLFAHQR